MTRLGQHFLTDPPYLERIVEAAHLAVGDTVLEVGPGRGHLTQHLVDAGAHVIAIEIDARLASKLPERVDDPDQRLTVTEADAVEASWPAFDKFVANLPYQASSPLVFRLLEHDFELAVITVQKEFAERMCAPVGTKHASRLTVKVALEAQAETLFTIPPGAFTPSPDVDSATVLLTPKGRVEARDEALLHALIDKAFQHRRKMLRSSLRGIEGARAALTRMGIETKRPAKLEPATWVKLADNVAKTQEPNDG